MTTIVITGMGAVTAAGPTARSSWDAVVAGRHAFARVELFDPAGHRSAIAAEVVSLPSPPGDPDIWSRTDIMSWQAGGEALAEAGLEPACGRLDLVLGGTTAGMFETETLLAEMHGATGSPRPDARLLSHPLSATVDRLAEGLAPFRRARTVCSACSSGVTAIVLAASWLRQGHSEMVLAGGADGLCRLTYAGFNALGALDPEPCRPFDRSRAGLTLGEGAAFLVLETEASARARGQPILAELRGWALGAEAHHITDPEPTGERASRVIAQALARAEIPAGAIGYVNAHGTATPLNDRMEAAALRRVFGEVTVSSTKGVVGHTLGAAGALEAAFAVLATRSRTLPPTAGLHDVDEACRGLRHLREATEVAELDAVLSTSFGFGGSAGALIVTRPGAFVPRGAEAPRPVFLHAPRSAPAHHPFGEVLGPLDARGPALSDPGPLAALTELPGLDRRAVRRMDDAGRLATLAVGATELGPAAGAIGGAAYGAVDACAAYVRRLLEKGPRMASPAVFPNLLPSSPISHAAIYHRLTGPVFATAELGVTAEAAVLAAADLVSTGEADTIAAAGVEAQSPLTDAVLAPLHGEEAWCDRGAGAVAVSVGSRGVVALRHRFEGRGDAPALAWELDPGTVLVFGADDPQLIDWLNRCPPSWSTRPRYAPTAALGRHEAVGGLALAAVVAGIERGDLAAAVFLNRAPHRWVALHLSRSI